MPNVTSNGYKNIRIQPTAPSRRQDGRRILSISPVPTPVLHLRLSAVPPRKTEATAPNPTPVPTHPSHSSNLPPHTALPTQRPPLQTPPRPVPYHAAQSVNAGRWAASGPHDDHWRVSTYSSEKMASSAALLRAYAAARRGSSAGAAADAAADAAGAAADARRPKQPTDRSASAGGGAASPPSTAAAAAAGRPADDDRRRMRRRALLRLRSEPVSDAANDTRAGGGNAPQPFTAVGDATAAAVAALGPPTGRTPGGSSRGSIPPPEAAGGSRGVDGGGVTRGW